ncbi:hypothetical protein [Promicromonospora sp. NPDC057488]|uniref:hypothetical protein n=1 Tax=Promicromonospora sp. NPDC057488 TaxID=3346147 RepID=UPI0036723D6E
MGFLVRQVVFAGPDDARAGAALESGPESGVVCDPGPVGLWQLESILTGREFKDVMVGAPDPVKVVDEGRQVVLPLGDDLRDRLAGSRGLRGWTVAVQWAGTDEVRAEGLTVAVVRRLLKDLGILARMAQKQKEHLYLWIDVDPVVP